jgi:GNAT superfamily N-acetyltransferase
MNIRRGRPQDRSALENIQLRASTARPEYRDEILRHPDAISVASSLLSDGRVRVAETGALLVGFSVLLRPQAGVAELDGLFVDPPYWRQGIGSDLLLDAVAMARAEHALMIEVIANPLAQGFYMRLGFIALREVQTRFGKAWRMSLSLSRDEQRQPG